MKKIISIFFAACMLFSMSACGSNETKLSETSEQSTTIASSENNEMSDSDEVSSEQESVVSDENLSVSENLDTSENTSDETKVLVAYFSRADENYGVGVIEKGNTEIIAEMIAEETSGDLFHIERETAYPTEYDACTDEAKQEKDSNARPALAEDFSPDDYDVIYLGYPIWWSDMPMPVYTWLESHDFDGKTIIPFCTHAGSGMSGTEDNIKSTCTSANVLEGFEISGETAQNDSESARNEVVTWLDGIEIE